MKTKEAKAQAPKAIKTATGKAAKQQPAKQAKAQPVPRTITGKAHVAAKTLELSGDKIVAKKNVQCPYRAGTLRAARFNAITKATSLAAVLGKVVTAGDGQGAVRPKDVKRAIAVGAISLH